VRPPSRPSGTTVAVKVARLSALAALAAVIAVLVPGHGLSKGEPSKALNQEACGRVEYVSGLEAVFGRRNTHALAITYRNQVVGRGFVNANIIEECSGFKVVVRGIDTFDVGVDLQSEARREGFPLTLECVKAKQVGRIEAVFGHERDRAGANALVNRAAASGFPGLKYRNDPCGGFEVFLAGFKDDREAATFRDNARARGFNVVLERN
jgi:hypothetical protein